MKTLPLEFNLIYGKYASDSGFSPVGYLLHKLGVAAEVLRQLETNHPLQELRCEHGIVIASYIRDEYELDGKFAQIEHYHDTGRTELSFELLRVALRDHESKFDVPEVKLLELRLWLNNFLHLTAKL